MKVGDVVKLKSGGPAMTITFIDGENLVCEWFERDTNKRASFHINALQQIKL